MEKASKLIVLLIIFLTPLIPEAYNLGYEQIKVLLFIILTSIVFCFWISDKPRIKWDQIKTFSLVFIFALLITSISGLDFKNSFWGTQPYFQGWITYFFLFIFSLMVSSLNIPFKYYALSLSASALTVSSLALEDYILINFLGYNVPNYAGRVISTFGQPNFYSGFLLLTLSFSYYLFVIARSPRRSNLSRIGKIATLITFARDDKLRVFGWGSGLASVLAIIASESRSAIFLMMVLILLMLLNQLKFKFLIGVIVYGAIILSAVAGLYFSSGIIGKEISKPLVTTNPDLTRESVEQRAYIWPVALQIINEKPIMGQGLENISKSFSNYFKDNFYLLFEANKNKKVSPVLLSLKELNIDRSHNYPLDLLIFSGFLGFLAWIFLIFMLFRKLLHKDDDRQNMVVIVSLIIYLIWIQFQNQSIVHLIYFWLLIGLISKERY